MTSTETTETAYDWLLEIFDSQDGWRTWAHDWNDTNPAGPGTLAQQLVDKHCEHLNRDWRIHIWPATGEYRHTNKPIHELTGELGVQFHELVSQRLFFLIHSCS